MSFKWPGLKPNKSSTKTSPELKGKSTVLKCLVKRYIEGTYLEEGCIVTTPLYFPTLLPLNPSRQRSSFPQLQPSTSPAPFARPSATPPTSVGVSVSPSRWPAPSGSAPSRCVESLCYLLCCCLKSLSEAAGTPAANLLIAARVHE